MASAVSPPRQLAPTVGPAAVLDGVMIRTGNFINTGDRIVSGLVRRLDLCDYVSDNAGSFKGKKPRATASSSTWACTRSTSALTSPAFILTKLLLQEHHPLAPQTVRAECAL